MFLVIGFVYISVIFLKILYKLLFNKNNFIVIIFIVILIFVFLFIGKLVSLFIIVGVINGWILLIILGVIFIVSRKKFIVGNY